MKLIADQMGVPGAYFADRWMIDFGLFSLRLHRWYGTDDPAAYHDHGQWFITICLWGGYTDCQPSDILTEKHDRLRPGSIRFRRAEHVHTVQDVKNPTWTLLIFGPPRRRWSFFSRFAQDPRRWRRDKYFAEVGHHTPTGERIRLRPDGSRI